MGWVETIYQAITYDASNFGLVWGGDCLEGPQMPHYAANYAVGAMVNAKVQKSTDYLNTFFSIMCHHENMDVSTFASVIHKCKSRMNISEVQASHVYMKESSSKLFCISTPDITTLVMRSNKDFSHHKRAHRFRYNTLMRGEDCPDALDRTVYTVAEGDVVIVLPSFHFRALGMDNIQKLVSAGAVRAVESLKLSSSTPTASEVFKNTNAQMVAEKISLAILNAPSHMYLDPSKRKEIGRSVMTGIVVKANNLFFPSPSSLKDSDQVLQSYGACDARQFICNYSISIIERTLFAFCVNALETALFHLPHSAQNLRQKMMDRKLKDDEDYLKGNFTLIYRYEKLSNPRGHMDSNPPPMPIKGEAKEPPKLQSAKNTSSDHYKERSEGTLMSAAELSSSLLELQLDDDEVAAQGCFNFRFFNDNQHFKVSIPSSSEPKFSKSKADEIPSSPENKKRKRSFFEGCLATEPEVPHSPAVSANNNYDFPPLNVAFNSARPNRVVSPAVSAAASPSHHTVTNGQSNNNSSFNIPLSPRMNYHQSTKSQIQQSPSLSKFLNSPPASPGILQALRNISSPSGRSDCSITPNFVNKADSSSNIPTINSSATSPTFATFNRIGNGILPSNNNNSSTPKTITLPGARITSFGSNSTPPTVPNATQQRLSFMSNVSTSQLTLSSQMQQQQQQTQKQMQFAQPASLMKTHLNEKGLLGFSSTSTAAPLGNDNNNLNHSGTSVSSSHQPAANDKNVLMMPVTGSRGDGSVSFYPMAIPQVQSCHPLYVANQAAAPPSAVSSNNSQMNANSRGVHYFYQQPIASSAFPVQPIQQFAHGNQATMNTSNNYYSNAQNSSSAVSGLQQRLSYDGGSFKLPNHVMMGN
eukprot:GDKJ01065045.1.p1 GENE.GDKJ01065045.1~~GDKJ01065045.1.p1  ORF type:complete len:869 (-),score=203.92 GDKJ01065045.1:355-2961(-)